MEEETKQELPTIVVGVDGSPQSKDALRWAVDEAKLRGATLHVVQAWHEAAGLWANPVGPAVGAVAWPEHELAEEARATLRETIKETLGDPVGVELRASVAVGSPAKALVDTADADHADLLVVGSRGRGGFRSLLLGSVSEQVVTHAHCPVAVIRHAA